MEQQGTHEQSIARGHGAEKAGMPAEQLPNASGGKATQAMRAGQDAQSTVGLIGVVKVEPDGQHLPEKFDGRLNVGNAILRAPRPEAWNLGAGAKSQRQILVPRNQPIRFGRLVEVDGADWKRFRWKMLANEIEKPWRTRQPGDSGQSKKTATPCTGDRAKRGKQLPPLIRFDNTRNDPESVLLDFMIHRRTRAATTPS